MNKTKKRVVGLVVIGGWLVMTLWLVRREWGPDLWGRGEEGQVFLSAPSDPLEPTESWMGLFVGDQEQVGWIHVRQEPEERQGMIGARMDLDTQMSLNLLGRPTNLELTGVIWRSVEVPRADFEFAVRSAEYDFGLSGTVADGLLRGEIRSAGEITPLEMAIDEELIFANGFGSALQFPDLEVGEEARLTSFDPLTFSKSPMRVRCIERETLVIAGTSRQTRRLHVETGGLEVRVWIDEEGEVVQAETPLGLTLRQIAPPEGPLVATAGGDELLDLTAIHPSGERVFRGARTLVLRLSGTERGLPEDALQVALGEGRYKLTSAARPQTASGDSGDDMTPFLGSDAFVQSDHPKIRSQAAEIVGDEEDLWQRALALHEWVFLAVEKEPVVSIPSALEVLEKRRGDCNEHTVLFTALARAAGLPTRIAIGLVWSDQLDGFYYHAWPEVHVGAWTPMDPTLDQVIADATHVKILNGGIERWPQLLSYLGQVQIEVLEIE